MAEKKACVTAPSLKEWRERGRCRGRLSQTALGFKVSQAGWGFCHRHMSPRGPRDARRPARRQLDTAPEDVKITTRVMGTRRRLRPGAERLGGRPGSRRPPGLMGVGAGREDGTGRGDEADAHPRGHGRSSAVGLSAHWSW